jgi:hypothetical protein
MKRVLFVVALVVMALSGCHKHAIRDVQVYNAELTMWNTWATKLAGLTVGFMALSCACDESGKFTTTECAEAADFVLTVQARHAWHMQMALYNGGITDQRPDKALPQIPPSKTLCPGGE